MEVYNETTEEYYERFNRNENLDQLRSEIRQLSNEQRELKNQRKTVNLVGERTMEPWKAIAIHHQNRQRLCLLFAAYNVIRGKEIEEPKTKDNHFGRWDFYTDAAIQKVVDEFSKKWLPDFKDEYTKMDNARHEKIMEELNQS